MRGFIFSLFALLPSAALCHDIPEPSAIDAKVQQVMTETGAKGMAIAVIDQGSVNYVKAYGVRNAKGDPLQPDTVMYGASLTKPVFAYTVMQQVDRGKIKLDRSIADYLPQPLPSYTSPEIVDKYTDWSELDARWKKLTPRILLSHSSGFANFGFLEPDGKLKFHFEPGARYAYSGDGLLTLQFVMEQGLGIDVGTQTDRVFKDMGMTRTSLIWRDDFQSNLADGWDEKGQIEPHDERSKVRASGSMDTTIDDFSKFAARFVRTLAFKRQGRSQMVRPQLHITTATQFPTLQPELPADKQRPDIYAGLGLVIFNGPQGAGFFKGGHNDTTANTWVCVEQRLRCVVILSNDVRSEKAFPDLVGFILGDTGVPFDWEYGFTQSAR